ncbi:hypothetical protein FHE66_13110 [Georgenia sp. 311]|uniref:immunoglobulin-like domain-containing protein n=1 Tax=Georgenia sp. 311 TaxID=2585134 RepID=UPI001112591C|nr:immunoglobulin-like domain-containing protein [Georgenia sp. 311]TNC16977.1 hypothetical protein FHE66_13110 [Georgenia sp. 311]
MSPRPHTRTRLRTVGAVAALTMVLGAAAAVPASSEPDAEPSDERLVAHYRLDETSGTAVADSSGNDRHAEVVNNGAGTATWRAGRGINLPGGSNTPGTLPAVKLPDSLLTGLDDVTIAFDVRAAGTAPGAPMYTFGLASENGGNLTASPGNDNAIFARHEVSIAAPSGTAQTAGAPLGLPRNEWTHVAVTIEGGTAEAPGTMHVYENGVLVGSNEAVTVRPGDITAPSAFIGRSNATTGRPAQFAGAIKDFRIYSAALPAADVAELSADLAAGNLTEMIDSVSLPDTSALEENVTLPSFPGLTWSTSDPSVVTESGRVTRPEPGAGDATATLTATVAHRGLTTSREFAVTVLERVAFSDEELSEGLVHHFRLDETAGTVLANTGSAGSAANAELVNGDKVSLTGEGVRFNPDSYENSLTGGYVRLPNNLTAGMTSLTVDYEVWVDPANVGNHQMWSLGSKTGTCEADAGLQGSIYASNTAPRPGERFRVAVGNQNLMQDRGRLLEGAWKHVTYTQTPNADGTTWTGIVYVDGVRYAQATNLTTPPSVHASGTNCNFLARSQVAEDYSFRGTIRDFRVYDRAVSLDEALALADETVSTGVRADAEAIDLGLTEAIVRDIVLPEFGSVAGSTITWTSSDPSVVDIYTPPASAPNVAVTGRVTRPAVGQPDATVTLTATVRKGAYDVTVREIPVVVKAEFVDADAVDRDAYDLEVDNTDDVRGNLTLPAEGEFGSTITWTSTSDLITPTGEVTRPAYGHADVSGTLTATITKGGSSETKTFPFTVRSLPRTEEMERYFLGYFKGENLADGEQIMFATSNGNTALDWTGLTGGRPSLISQLGDQGLRDPHIVRSPDGDTFYMIATDLNWYDQGGYAINDTQYIEVFESNDLVSWTPQRHVEVAPEDAGNAFAPESLWVEEIGAYAVFWAQSLWNDPVNRTGQGNAQMWYNTTRDFRTFSEPQVWQDPYPQSRIDTTALKVGDYYYRVTKNEAGNAGSDLFSEKHTDFLDSDIDNWELLAPALGRTTWDAGQGYEGPVLFQANPGDTACPGQFYLWGDRYTNGGGYQAACSEDIEAPTWDPQPITMTNAGVPRPRHGTVIPITLREWNDIRGIPNSDVATTTELSVEGRVATATVEAADGFETGGQVRFSAGEWSQTVHLTDGVAEVTLPEAATGPEVTAEFLGHDILLASSDTAPLGSPLDGVTATADTRCVAGRTVVTVRVSNGSEVAVDLTATSSWGSRSATGVAEGRNFTHAFTTRATSVPAGTVTVDVSAVVDGEQTTTQVEAPYAAGSCG